LKRRNDNMKNEEDGMNTVNSESLSIHMTL